MFKADLSLYDPNGKLRKGIDQMERYCFICIYCWKTTRLEFSTFSHPSMILHLKHIERLHKQQLNAIKKLNDTFHSYY